MTHIMAMSLFHFFLSSGFERCQDNC